MKRRCAATTMVELLVVVGTISLLVAIAVPNYLEAQTRAKVSRAKNDLRTAVLALEAYHADNSAYPPHRGPGTGGFGEWEQVHVLDGYGQIRNYGFRTLSLRLSTPVAYVTSTAIPDVFKPGSVDLNGRKYESGDPTDLALCYQNIHQYAILQMTPGFFEDDFNRDYGHWRVFSLGPSRTFATFGTPDRGYIYDPTNGTNSRGFILRTQLSVEGDHLAVPN